MRRSAALALAALALAPAASALPPYRGVLVPGKSLGGLRLGSTAAQVKAAWGSAFGACRGCGQPTWYFNYRPFHPEGAGVAFHKGRVEAIFTLWSPAGWRTTRGLQLGANVAEITTVYGPLTRTECGSYYVLVLPRGHAVNVFYVKAQQLWGFGLSRAGVPVCR